MGATSVTVRSLPACAVCGQTARYDARTKQGPWAYLCEGHYRAFGIGLGPGRGQRLVLPGEAR